MGTVDNIMVAGAIGMVALPMMGMKKRLQAEWRPAAEFLLIPLTNGDDLVTKIRILMRMMVRKQNARQECNQEPDVHGKSQPKTRC